MTNANIQINPLSTTKVDGQITSTVGPLKSLATATASAMPLVSNFKKDQKWLRQYKMVSHFPMSVGGSVSASCGPMQNLGFNYLGRTYGGNRTFSAVSTDCNNWWMYYTPVEPTQVGKFHVSTYQSTLYTLLTHIDALTMDDVWVRLHSDINMSPSYWTSITHEPNDFYKSFRFYNKYHHYTSGMYACIEGSKEVQVNQI